MCVRKVIACSIQINSQHRCGRVFIDGVFDTKVHPYLCTYVKANISNYVRTNIEIHTYNSNTHMYDCDLTINRKSLAWRFWLYPFTFIADI